MEHLQQKSLSYPELASFCGEMGMILRSGISALEGLELLMEDTKTMRKRLCWTPCISPCNPAAPSQMR